MGWGKAKTIMVDSTFYMRHCTPWDAQGLIDAAVPEHCDLVGDEASRLGQTFDRVATLEDADEKAFSYYSDARYRTSFLQSKAGLLICRPEDRAMWTKEQGGRDSTVPLFLLTKRPLHALARILAKLVRERERDEWPLGQRLEEGIQPSAQVAPDAKIGDGCRIAPGVVIGPRAIVGNQCVIGPHVVIGSGVVIGDDCRIETGCSMFATRMGSHCVLGMGVRLGGVGFRFVRDGDRHLDIPHIGRVIIGEDVHIGDMCCVTRGVISDTCIGDRVRIDSVCEVAHNAQIGADTAIAGHSVMAGSAWIGRGVMMGGAVGIGPSARVGDGAIVAAGTRVTGSVPAGELYAGHPARPLRTWLRASAELYRLVKTER